MPSSITPPMVLTGSLEWGRVLHQLQKFLLRLALMQETDADHLFFPSLAVLASGILIRKNYSLLKQRDFELYNIISRDFKLKRYRELN